MDLQELGYRLIEWIVLAKDRDSWWGLVNAVKNKYTGSIKGAEFLD